MKLVISDETHSDSIIKPDYIYIDFGVGIQAQKKNDNVEIFPNPTTGIIHISGEDIEEIDVFDITGSKVRSISYVKLEEIDLSHLDQGIYFLKIRLQNETIISRKVSLLR